MITSLQLFEEFVRQDFTDGQIFTLVDYRGGCHCHVRPPCMACSEPLTYEEFVHLFLDGCSFEESTEFRTIRCGQKVKKPYEPDSIVSPDDAMAAVRAMCK